MFVCGLITPDSAKTMYALCAPASRPAAAPKSDDVVIQDLDSNQNINLDDIPF
jgi:hypothetical protein